MIQLVSILLLSPCLYAFMEKSTSSVLPEITNSSDPNKDMYVIKAMVYQVGILTNKTDNRTNNEYTTGQQEAITFFNTNGSNVDLSQIPPPLLTNVTAQSLVGVAPVTSTVSENQTLPWTGLNLMTAKHSGNPEVMRKIRSTDARTYSLGNTTSNTTDQGLSFLQTLFKRSMKLEKNVSENETTVKIEQGSAFVPKQASVQSIGLPALMKFNNNLSVIPVPIPNTSVVHYTKLNALVHMP